MNGVFMKENVLITGASGDIGLACARLFAAEGYGVALHYNSNRAPAAALAEEINANGGRAVAVCADLSQPEQAEVLIREVRTVLGNISVLVNNAGIADIRLFTDTDAGTWRRIISANLDSVYACTYAAAKGMINRKNGSIINISSVWGVYGASCEVAYSASKAGIIGFTKALAKELGPSNIRVNCVAPGVIDTKMNGHLSDDDIASICDQTPLCRMGTSEEVAQAVLFLAGDKSSFITGAVLEVTGGFC